MPNATNDIATEEPPKTHILFVVSEDWYFWSHRLPTARAARDLGFQVSVATNFTQHEDLIRKEGFRVICIPPLRRLRWPFGHVIALYNLVRIYRRERPDIIHHIALVPTLFGSVAALFSGAPRSISTMTGLGFIFTSERLKPRGIRAVVKPVLRWVLSRSCNDIVFQNEDDLNFFVRKKIIHPERAHLILGSGVDTVALQPVPEPKGVITAIFVGRILRTKGVEEIAQAARLLRDRAFPIRIVLVGMPDPNNPESIDDSQIREWQTEGLIEWWGFRPDIANVWAEANIALLPSYREGLPKSLLEAAASGRAMIAADVPGCREIVHHGSTGLLVPPQDASALADAISHLARDAEMRGRMGIAARTLVETSLSDKMVTAQMQTLYLDIMARQ